MIQLKITYLLASWPKNSSKWNPDHFLKHPTCWKLANYAAPLASFVLEVGTEQLPHFSNEDVTAMTVVVSEQSFWQVHGIYP